MKPDKEKYYENATRKLLEAIDKMKMDKLPRLRAKNMVRYFRDSFKLPDVKQKTFRPDLGNNIDKFTYDSDGFCRAASIDFAALMNDDKSEWEVMFIDENWAHGPHHYLLHVPSNTVFDLTYDQYENTGITVPYHLGKPVKYEIEEDDTPVRFAKAVGLKMPLIDKQKD